MRLTRVIFFVSLLFSISGYAQDTWDYQSYPAQQVDFKEADIKLTISPEQARIGGVVTYKAVALRDGVANVILHGTELSIDAVTINGETAEFEVSGDSINVQFSDTLSENREVSISVTWQSTSGFGFHSESDSLIWSSLLPKAVRHWLPVFDHPRNELKLFMDITVPEGYTAIGPGTLLNDKIIVGEGLQTYSWQTKTPVPASAISWTAGNFSVFEAPLDTHKIRLFVPDGIKTDSAKELNQAVDIVRAVTSQLGQSYPYGDLNIVILERTFGELRNYAATKVYLFNEEEEITSQLMRGIAAQWFGVSVRQEKYEDQQHISSLLQALVLENQTNIGIEKETKVSTELPELFQLNSEFNNWLKADFNVNDSVFFTELKSLLPVFYKDFTGVTNWEYFSEIIYQRTGLPYLQVPAASSYYINADTVNQRQQPVISYDLTYKPNEGEGTLDLIFEAGGQSDLELESGTLTLFSFSDSTSKEISFTGQSDTVSVSINPATEWAYFSVPDSGIVIREYKPVLYWLGQLRRGNAELRLEAATGLRNHTDNPDLQLALLDVFDAETNPQVKAALLQTFSETTAGATGTEQRFLDELGSNFIPVKVEALRALRAYENEPRVVQALQSQVLKAEPDTVFKTAVESFVRVADSVQVSDIFERIVEERGIDKRTVFMAEAILPFVSANKIINSFDTALAQTRSIYGASRVLKLMQRLDENAESWEQRLRVLAESTDPRLRFLVTRYMALLSANDRKELVDELLGREEDWRIRQSVSR